MQCKICNTESINFTIKIVLAKYDVTYFKCPHCCFIQTENPFWLHEAYNNAITQLDIGLVYRNGFFTPIVSSIINSLFDADAKFVDYGGGYGLFVRMMRDRGYEFFRQDIYCENLFAKHFDIIDLPGETKFELLTAFEVFEHLENPYEEIEKMLHLSDNILFSTELQPENSEDLKDWWYFTPETGQHISLYSPKSLQVIAKRYKLHLLSYKNLHLLSKNNKSETLFKLSFRRSYQKLGSLYRKRNSLLAADYIKVKKINS